MVATKVKLKTVIVLGLIGLSLLPSLFSACTKTGGNRLEVEEPGAVIQGDSRNMRGDVYVSDILYSDGNFWSQGVPADLEKWMNGRSYVKVRFMPRQTAMKSVYLSPPSDVLPGQVDAEGLFKQPMLLLSGKDDGTHFSVAERQNLRKYLVERGGFLFIDDSSNVEGEFYRSIRIMLEAALPTHPVEPISNDHEIYSCFYHMGGPPVGSTSMYRPLEGIFINGRLAVLISQHGYWDSFTGRAEHYSPGALRFGMNMIIYAVTHGQISDYSAYTPAYDR